MTRSKWKVQGFTLIELLVVIAIIAVLVALLLPAVQQAREAARRSQCKNNLKQYGLALANYHDTYSMYPLGGTGGFASFPVVGFQTRILPYLDQSPLYNMINFSFNGSAVLGVLLPTGKPLGSQVVPVTVCPSDGRMGQNPNSNWTFTINGTKYPMANASYDGSQGSQHNNSSSGSCNPYNQFALQATNNGDTGDIAKISGMGSRWGPSIAIRDVLDGTSNTIHMGEVLPSCNDHAALGGAWTSHGQGDFTSSTIVPINEFTTCSWASPAQVRFPTCTNWNNWNISWGFRSLHSGGAQFLFVDGSVHFLSQSLNHQTYQFLGGRADGNTVGEY